MDNSNIHKPPDKFTAPHARPLTGEESFAVSIYKFLKNPLEGFGPLAYGQPIVSLPTFGYKTHVISDPEGMWQVLGTESDKFSKAPIDSRILSAATKEGLLRVNGEQWRRQRRGVAPIFRPKYMAQLAPIISDVIGDFIKTLPEGASIDLNSAMADITFDVLSKALLGDPQGVDRDKLRVATRKVVTSAGTLRPDDLLPWQKWVPRPILPSGMMALRRLKKSADILIESREPDASGEDLVGLLISTTDPHTGEPLTHRERRDNLIGFFIAGHETTALTLTWAIYLIANDDQVRDRMRREIQQATDGAPVNYEHLSGLDYCRAVVNETLRLFPPAPILLRECQDETIVLTREMKPRDILILNNYIMHRTERLWDRPHEFDPERFMENPDLARKGSAFMPFGAGPRICVGAAFAMMEAMLVLTNLVRAYDFEIPEDCFPNPKMTVTLRPDQAVPVQFRRR